MSAFLLIIIVAIFGGDAMASDAAWGNLRFVLMRPVGRVRLLAAKLAGRRGRCRGRRCSSSCSSALVAGGIAFGWHPLDAPRFENGQLTVIHQSIGTLLLHLGARDRVRVVDAHRARRVHVHALVHDRLAGRRDRHRGRALHHVADPRRRSSRSVRSATCCPPTTSTRGATCIFEGHATSDMARGALLMVGYMLLFTGLAVWWFRRKDILS